MEERVNNTAIPKEFQMFILNENDVMNAAVQLNNIIGKIDNVILE